MNFTKLAGAVLLALGILALVYKGFSYTQERHEANLGPIEFAVEEKEQVTIPTWLGIVAVVGGGLLLAAGRRS